MDTLNKTLKIIFILCAFLLLYLLVTLPKTNCEACNLEYDGKKIRALKAFEIFEDACISYDKPWGAEPMINFTIINLENGYQE